MSSLVRTIRHALLAALLAVTAGVCPAAAQGQVQIEPGIPVDQTPAALTGVGYAQRLGAQVPADLTFVDETGAAVRLGDYFGMRPVVLALAYYECPMLCTQVLTGMTAGLKGLKFSAGQEFEVVVVSFDPGEGPGLAAAKKAAYVDHYDREGTSHAWHFLTGRKADIDRLAATVGFTYTYDEKTDQYAHAAGLTVLTPEGRISRYFFGIDFAPRDLRLGLVEASNRAIATPVDTALLYCFHYDPSTGTYGLVAMNVVRAAGVLMVLAMGLGWVLLRRRERRGDFDHTPTGVLPGASHKA
ncbi:MAG: SCO family protein [Acidobacteria bacterium]|nr:SCO family protein [Acidobacteriota bacterium]